MHQVEIRKKGIRSAQRNRKPWEAFYSGWDRASLELPPDPPKGNYGLAGPDAELGEYHRMGWRARTREIAGTYE